MRAETNSLLESPEILNTIFEDAPDGMLVIAAGGEIVKANKQAAVLFGYPIDELVGRPVEILVPQRAAQIHPKLRAEYFAAPHPLPMGVGRVLFGLRKDGTEFPVEIMLSPLFSTGTPLVLTVVRDVSERNQLEAKLQAARDTHLKEVHHRMKNNLQIVSSLLHLQSSYVTDPRLVVAFKETEARVKSMALIHEKLYNSSDLITVDFKSYVTDLIAELIKSYSLLHEDLAVEVAIEDVYMELETAIPCGLMINELISNVLKHAFNPGEKGRLRIKLTSDDAGASYLLTVSDDGKGLPKDFNWRERKSLGIRLVSDLASQLGGTLKVTVDRGTTVSISFFPHRTKNKE